MERIAKFLNGEIVIYSRDVWEKIADYDVVIALIATGIVVRGICSVLRNKWVDPAIIVVDKSMRYAIPIIGGHHGGNKMALRLEEIGMKAVITTAMEFEDGLSVGVGFRRSARAEEIIEAIENALNEVDADVKDVRVISTWEGKRGDEIMRVADYFKRPLFFLKDEEINKQEVESGSKAEMIGLKSVCEACALHFSIRKELVLKKKVHGGVTVAIAR